MGETEQTYAMRQVETAGRGCTCTHTRTRSISFARESFFDNRERASRESQMSSEMEVGKFLSEIFFLSY